MTDKPQVPEDDDTIYACPGCLMPIEGRVEYERVKASARRALESTPEPREPTDAELQGLQKVIEGAMVMSHPYDLMARVAWREVARQLRGEGTDVLVIDTIGGHPVRKEEPNE